MHLLTVILIAVGLAMDAFAVSIITGRIYRELHIKYALRMALFFGTFQAAMPIVGSLAGWGLKRYIFTYDHWVGFGLLAFVEAKIEVFGGLVLLGIGVKIPVEHLTT